MTFSISVTSSSQQGNSDNAVSPDRLTAPATTSTAEQPSAQITSQSGTEIENLKSKLQRSLRQFPDFPIKGILFADILPIFQDPQLHIDLLRALELHIAEHIKSEKPDIVVGLEARGFLFGPSLALRLGAGFVPVRKQGKLPGPTETASYEKEYGQDFFQIQSDGIKPGQKVLVVDDIIATGGSAVAAGSLIKKLGGKLLGYVFLLELEFLKGRDKLDAPVSALLSAQDGGPLNK